MTEKWLPVVGFEGIYEVSDLGRVRSLRRKVWQPRGAGFWRTQESRILKPSVARGYLRVTLRDSGVVSSQAVHRLVLTAFVGPCPSGMEACHFDDDPTNNQLSNLRWDTPSANHRDRTRNGRNPNALKTHCPHGHSLADAYRNPDGSRKCRACAIQRSVERKQRLRRAERKYAA